MPAETVIRGLGELMAYAMLAVLLYGIWRGTQRQPGRTTECTGTWLRSPLFYLITSALFLGLCFLGWKPLPVLVSPASRAWMLAVGSLLYFSGMLLALWARLASGKNYFASTGMGVQLFAGHQLITGGPFAILRHPMYAGIILTAFGSLLLYATWTTMFLAGFSPLISARSARGGRAGGRVWRAVAGIP